MSNTVKRTDGSDTYMTLERLLDSESSFAKVIIRDAELFALRSNVIDCAGAQFINVKLEHFDLENGNARSTHFHNVDACGTSFQRADLRGATFVKCNLEGCEFQNAQMSDCELLECSCKYIAFNHSFADASINLCTFSGSDFDQLDISGAVFRECHFQGVSFLRCDLRKLQFVNCHLNKVEFSNCWMEDIDFTMCRRFQDVTLPYCTIGRVSFPAGFVPAETRPLGSRFWWGVGRFCE